MLKPKDVEAHGISSLLLLLLLLLSSLYCIISIANPVDVTTILFAIDTVKFYQIRSGNPRRGGLIFKVLFTHQCVR